jgi:glycosyltransferase involved in cell wall biosynthesis
VSRYRVLEMIDKPSLGGGQRAVALLAGALDAATFEVAVCSPEGPLVEELKRLGIRHIPASFDRRHWRENIRTLRRLLRRESIDVLHTHGGVAGFFGRWAAWQVKTQVVVHTLHGIHYLHYRNPLLKWTYIRLERDFSRFTDRLVLVSDGDHRAALRHRLAPEGKMVVIKNGVDLRGLPSASDGLRLRRDLGLDPAGPVVGTVSRLHRQKGVAYLIRAAALLRDGIPGLKVLCVGGGPLESRMRRLVRRLRLGDTVRLVGESPGALRHLAALDVFVLPSLWEGLPFVLIEAAALGKPIVATDVEGNREVVTDGETGLLVPARDPGALAGAVGRLVSDPDLSARLGQAAARLIPPRFGLSRMIRATEELYLSTWREKHPLSR